jgi:DNA anti-recombination protein RmuC
MEAMTKSWTDERLEERFERIDQRFDEVDRRFDRVDADFHDLRAEMNARFAEINGRFAEMSSAIDATQRLIIQVGAGMFAMMLVGFLSLLTQL